MSTKSRIEFCSKIFVFMGGVNFWPPNPKKAFEGSVVSFDVGTSIRVAGMTKALALMTSCICRPFMLYYLEGIYRMHRESSDANAMHAVNESFKQNQWNYFATAKPDVWILPTVEL